MGVFWWGAKFEPLPNVHLGGYERSSIFYRDGNALPVSDAPRRLDDLRQGK
jgi:hypothetical protein